MGMRDVGGLKEAVQTMETLMEQGSHGFTFIKRYAWLLQECMRMKAVSEGRRIHALIQRNGLLPGNTMLANTLLNMYSKCGSLLDARRVFDNILHPDLFSWTAIISAHANQKRSKQAMALFQEMQNAGVIPDKFLLVATLKACAHMANLVQATEMHSLVIKFGFESDSLVGNNLVGMYIKCGSIENARQAFDRIHTRDVVSYNTMITGYAQTGQSKEALILFKRMQLDVLKPDNITFASILKACGKIADRELGKLIHDQLMKSGIQQDAVVKSSLVSMYAKCGNLADARKVFDKMTDRDVACWNAMVAGYAHQGNVEESLLLLEQMQREGINPNKVTFIHILKAGSSFSSLNQVKQVHHHITQGDFRLDSIFGSTLVNMYAKCGSIEDAWTVFSRMRKRDLVLWTAMITLYAQNGNGEEALRLLEQMQQDGLKPDSTTLLTILKACSSMGVLELGKEVHNKIIKSGFQCDILVGNSLVDMYSKCGSIQDAHVVFDMMCNRDVISWNALLAGYAQQGDAEEVLRLFKQMQQENITPDDITCLCVLSACNHAGLVVEGCQLFDSLIGVYDIKPMMEHYACLVDLLGRAGQLEQAEKLLSRMPVQPGTRVWLALLGACRNVGNVDLGIQSFEHIIRLNPQCAEAYASLKDICALVGRWDAVIKIRKEMEVT